MKKIFCIILFMFVFSSITVCAETADKLLKIYGVATAPTVEIEAAKLDKLENDCDGKKQALYSKQLVQSAKTIGQSQLLDWCREYDAQNFQIQTKLNDITNFVNSNTDSSPEVLIQKSAEYHMYSVELQDNNAKKKSIAGQLSALGGAPLITAADIQACQQSEQEVSKQKEVLSKARNYEDIGDVSSVKHPADDDLYVTSGFGVRWDPVSNSYYAMHKGMDFRAPTGTKVMAAWKGTVEDVCVTGTGGKTIWINHGNGIKTVYMHLSQQLVKVGQHVNQYDEIALSGNTGSSTTGPHLHVGIYINGNPVDPGKINWK